MPRKGKRKRIARNIYQDGSGRSLIIRDPQTGKPKEFRYPHDAKIADMRADAETWLRGRRSSGQRVTHRGTLNAAIAQWEPLEQHLASWRERRAELRAWAKALGQKRLNAIDEQDVRTVISQWSQAGLTPKTLRNRLWTLQHLYKLLHGPDAQTPCDHITPPPKVRTSPVDISPELILTVYRNLLAMELDGTLRNAKTRARFMVRAATGKRPCEIAWTKPEDVDLKRRIWRMRDAKGGHTPGGRIYLNDDMLIAWATFAKAEAWGPFDTGSFASVLRSAGWPEGVRPYNLRHAVGIALSESGVDLSDVSALLGHTRVQTTRSFYVPILNSRMQRAAQQIEGRLQGWNVAPRDGAPVSD